MLQIHLNLGAVGFLCNPSASTAKEEGLESRELSLKTEPQRLSQIRWESRTTPEASDLHTHALACACLSSHTHTTTYTHLQRKGFQNHTKLSMH